MNIIYLGWKQAGVIGLLTTLLICEVKAVVTGCDSVAQLAQKLGLPIYRSVRQIKDLLPETDLLISVHSREIISNEILNVPRLGGINVHPCLYRYKGKDPIRRFLKDGCTRASVGVHRMTDKVDEGETLSEIFVDIENVTQVVEVYNILYPYYSLVLLEALKKLKCTNY